jgi:hypothetical protein
MHRSRVGRSGSSRWNTRRGTLTALRYSPIFRPELHRLPFGIPAGVFGTLKNISSFASGRAPLEMKGAASDHSACDSPTAYLGRAADKLDYTLS